MASIVFQAVSSNPRCTVSRVLDKPEVSAEIKKEIDSLMKSIRESYAFKQLEKLDPKP